MLGANLKKTIDLCPLVQGGPLTDRQQALSLFETLLSTLFTASCAIAKRQTQEHLNSSAIWYKSLTETMKQVAS